MLRGVQCFFRASLWGVPVVCPTAVHDIVVGSALSHPDTKLQAATEFSPICHPLQYAIVCLLWVVLRIVHSWCPSRRRGSAMAWTPPQHLLEQIRATGDPSTKPKDMPAANYEWAVDSQCWRCMACGGLLADEGHLTSKRHTKNLAWAVQTWVASQPQHTYDGHESPQLVERCRQ
jgi:hypothetical protein